MANLTTIPRELFDQIFNELALNGKLAVSLACSKFYKAKPVNLITKLEKIQCEGYLMCTLWERDQFFSGLVCGRCLLIHPFEFFDKANRESCADNRECIKITKYVMLHPSWRMDFNEFSGIVRNLRKLRQCSLSLRVEEDLRTSRGGRDEVERDNVRLMVTRYWEFRSGSITIGKLFSAEDIRARFGFRDLKSELHWRGRIDFDFYDYGLAEMHCLQTFAVVRSSELSKRFKPDQELTQDDLDAWINPLQFFLSESGTIVVGIIWYLNLNCVRNSQPSDAKLIEEELESKGLCFYFCPHHKMNQSICISAMLKAYAQGSDIYPEQHPVIERCSRCSSIVRFALETPKTALISSRYGSYLMKAEKRCLMVAVLRDLGCAKSVVDPHWRAQWQRGWDVCSDDLASRATYKGDLQHPPGKAEDEGEYSDADEAGNEDGYS
ncbi:hypothetical protein MMC17_000874 [Xylographa soralifera]|nr:hypothetical protein [Xylographa soralifera]